MTPKPRPRTRSRVRLETPLVRRQPRPSRPTRTLTKRHTKSEARSRRIRSQLAKKVKGKSETGDESELTELSDSDNGANGVEHTPIVKRLRPRGVRGGNFMKEPSTDVTDFEDDAEEADAEATEVEEEPQPKERKSRSKSISQVNLSKYGGDVDMAPASEQRSSKSLPTRGAKKKAIERMQGIERGREDEDMEMDKEGDIEMEKGTPTPQPATPPRSGLPSPSSTPKLDQDSAMVDSPTLSVATETETTTRPVHTTRSGKAFGAIQNRRLQLLQEARNDPDMDDGDGSDEEDGQPELDVNLSEATMASLVRLLRDELVQMCEARGIEVGGTKPQLAKALLEWVSNFPLCSGAEGLLTLFSAMSKRALIHLQPQPLDHLLLVLLCLDASLNLNLNLNLDLNSSPISMYPLSAPPFTHPVNLRQFFFAHIFMPTTPKRHLCPRVRKVMWKRRKRGQKQS